MAVIGRKLHYDSTTINSVLGISMCINDYIQLLIRIKKLEHYGEHVCGPNELTEVDAELNK